MKSPLACIISVLAILAQSFQCTISGAEQSAPLSYIQGQNWDQWVNSYNRFLDSTSVKWHDSLLSNKNIFRAQDCWLFGKASLKYMFEVKPSAIGMRDGDLRLVADFSKRLKAKNISFIVVPLPNKTDLYADKIIGNRSNEIPNPNYYKVLNQFAAEGIECINILDTMNKLKNNGNISDHLFLSAYDFFSPKGIEFIAEAISEKLKMYPWYGELARTPYTSKESKDGNFTDVNFDSMQKECLKDTLHFNQVFSEDGQPYKACKTAPIVISGQSTRLYEDIISKNAGLPSLVAEKLATKTNWVILWMFDLKSYLNALEKRISKKNTSPKAIVFVIDILDIAKTKR
jgi:hypothetical protein